MRHYDLRKLKSRDRIFAWFGGLLAVLVVAGAVVWSRHSVSSARMEASNIGAVSKAAPVANEGATRR
jgi:hypothetical protein